jgi:hypothetical protein
MKAAHIVFYFGTLLAAATPTMAAVQHGAQPVASRVVIVQPKIPATEPLVQPRTDSRETSLPLECRGFYLQQVRPALSRCN